MGVHCELNLVSTDHVYSGNVCIHCGEGEGAGGIKTGDALINEIPGNEKAKTNTALKCPGKPPLDNNGIQVLTGVFEVYGRIMAIQARIDGMKVRNTCNELNGNFPEYRQRDFTKAADNIYQCVEQLKVMKTLNVVA